MRRVEGHKLLNIDNIDFYEKKQYHQVVKLNKFLHSISQLGHIKKQYVFFMHLLLKTVKVIGANDKSTREDVLFQIEDIYLELSLEYDYENSAKLDKFQRNFLEVFANKLNYPHFRGEVTEYIVYHLVNMDVETTELYHEPEFLLNGVNIFENQFDGWNCLIDVVQRKENELLLIECKSSLLNQYSPRGGKCALNPNEKFAKKVNLLEKSKEYFSQTCNSNKEVIHVESYVATFVFPLGEIPENHKKIYSKIDVYGWFEEQKSNYLN